MHFIVTGGAGFIGSHVTEQLLANGDRVTILDNFSTGKFKNLPDYPQLTLVQKSILDCTVEDFNQPVDGIAHLAATPSVESSWLDPLAAHNNNLSATLATIQLCDRLQCPRLVFASSAAVYGMPETLPIAEDHPTKPISPYGLQKLVSEQYGQLFANKYGFTFVALRLFNVFGDRQDPQSPYSGVISKFLEAMKNNTPITMYGDGSQTRDFISVNDIAIAFTQALKRPLPATQELIVNIGTGRSLSLLELIEKLKQCFPHWQENIQFAPARTGDIQHSLADIGKGDRYLEFEPKQSIEETIHSLI
ncbi:NAD-dependent epimerase/dehydratase family protein [Spirulina sp. 06S082]|uniref:NAD-dependent epimerase/dehydratase family protein n=1 Tax=Spirulina sp. 06S082 TaxID=3110248 RepID=UPI002B1F8010|nr:NAD-dependent epimerase/dehydratase family protein [Spirulina sp. 06S082]MEA5470682.1 NAD-dependent epimerase/dehydratase family protein [Spirulina sp. 06S082]